MLGNFEAQADIVIAIHIKLRVEHAELVVRTAWIRVDAVHDKASRAEGVDIDTGAATDVNNFHAADYTARYPAAQYSPRNTARAICRYSFFKIAATSG